MKKIGFSKTSDQSDADCYLINTCHIRDKAKEKVYHEIGRVKESFKFKKKPIVIVAGCVAQAENEEMLEREPYIDLVIGPQAYHKLNNIIIDNPNDIAALIIEPIQGEGGDNHFRDEFMISLSFNFIFLL